MKVYSLRRATLGALVIPMLAALVLAGASGIYSARRAITSLRDQAMQQEAAFILTLSRHEAAEGEQIGTVHTDEPGALADLQTRGMGFRIWSGDRVITQAGTLPPAEKYAPTTGFADIVAGGSGWRRFVASDADLPIQVEVTEPATLRDESMWDMVASIAPPLLMLVIAVGLIVSYRVATALRPLDRMSQAIRARHQDDLSPFAEGIVPVEVVPLIDAVNDLMSRLGAAVDSERAFSDNAAHELRTPLAVLKTRAQLVQQAMAGIPGQELQLARLIEATDRATAVIEQLLLLSRLQSGLAGFGPIDLSELTLRVTRELAGPALASRHHIEADIAPGLTVNGNADALEMLITNLLTNAIKHAPAEGAIEVILAAEQDGVSLHVRDEGPGIPDHLIDHAFDRFSRFRGADTEGAGLGLSIVRQIAVRHQATVTLENRATGGLDCTVRFGGKTEGYGATSAR